MTEAKSKKAGFTLVEILVVVGVAVALATIAVGFSTSSRDRTRLQIEAAKIGQLILRAKSLTLATYGDPIPPCGFGFEIDYALNQYRIFRYAKDVPPPGDFPCNNIEQLSLVSGRKQDLTEGAQTLLSGVVFKSGGARSLDDVLFVAPDPTIVLFTEGIPAPDTTAASGVIRLETTDGSGAITIDVSTAGQISFSN